MGHPTVTRMIGIILLIVRRGEAAKAALSPAKIQKSFFLLPLTVGVVFLTIYTVAHTQEFHHVRYQER